jgi:hypothetical protein
MPFVYSDRMPQADRDRGIGDQVRSSDGSRGLRYSTECADSQPDTDEEGEINRDESKERAYGDLPKIRDISPQSSRPCVYVVTFVSFAQDFMIRSPTVLICSRGRGIANFEVGVKLEPLLRRFA